MILYSELRCLANSSKSGLPELQSVFAQHSKTVVLPLGSSSLHHFSDDKVHLVPHPMFLFLKSHKMVVLTVFQ